MGHYRLVLMVAGGILLWLQMKMKGKYLENRYFLDFLSTTSLLLLLYSFFQGNIYGVITLSFDVYMVLIVVFYTIKVLGRLKEQFCIMGDRVYVCLLIFLWCSFGVSFVQSLVGVKLPFWV